MKKVVNRKLTYKNTQNFKQKRFIHNGMEYVFKWAKKQFVLEQMPPDIGMKITNYFNIIAQGVVPIDLFNNPFILRCSKFRVKNLQRGAQRKISQYLIENSRIFPIVRKSNNQSINKLTEQNSAFLNSILEITEKTFVSYWEQGYNDYKPSHDEVLSSILLQHDGALSVEVPVWTRKKSSLEQFLVKNSENEPFSCNFVYSLTGHIDLLLWDSSTQCFIVADYKPEGYFLRSLPQVAVYALILQKNLELPKILCLSFNKDEAWLYSPQILIEDINPMLEQYGNPSLKWRKIVKSFYK